MALIDRCHLKHSFYVSRRIRDWLEDHGYRVNRKKIQRLMRTKDLVAQYPKAQPQLGEPDTRGVSVPAARPRHRSPESGVGNGYHVYPDGPGFVLTSHTLTTYILLKH